MDAFTPSKDWYEANTEPLTIDGSQLNDEGYKLLGTLLADQLFGKESAKSGINRRAGIQGRDGQELDVAQRL